MASLVFEVIVACLCRQAATIFALASGTESRNVCKGVLP